MNKHDDLMTIEQTAGHLGISTTTLQKLRLDQDLDFPKKVKHAGRIMFSQEAVDQ